MVSKSSDGDARPGSSSDPQPTEPMQTSNDITSPVLGKRKDPNESEGDRESVDDDEDEDEEEEDSDYHWDKDSFDGQVYHSVSDDNSNCTDDEEHEKMSCYHRTVIESKGFYDQNDGFPDEMWGGICRIKNLDDEIEEGVTIRQFLINLATECVKKYNRRKNKTVRFHDFVRANYHSGGFSKYYITFVARESDSLDDPLIEYQAKVGRQGGKTYPILCRPSSPL